MTPWRYWHLQGIKNFFVSLQGAQQDGKLLVREGELHWIQTQHIFLAAGGTLHYPTGTAFRIPWDDSLWELWRSMPALGGDRTARRKWGAVLHVILLAWEEAEASYSAVHLTAYSFTISTVPLAFIQTQICFKPCQYRRVATRIPLTKISVWCSEQ